MPCLKIPMLDLKSTQFDGGLEFYWWSSNVDLKSACCLRIQCHWIYSDTFIFPLVPYRLYSNTDAISLCVLFLMWDLKSTQFGSKLEPYLHYVIWRVSIVWLRIQQIYIQSIQKPHIFLGTEWIWRVASHLGEQSYPVLGIWRVAKHCWWQLVGIWRVVDVPKWIWRVADLPRWIWRVVNVKVLPSFC